MPDSPMLTPEALEVASDTGAACCGCNVGADTARQFLAVQDPEALTREVMRRIGTEVRYIEDARRVIGCLLGEAPATLGAAE